jgi:hypothetical protein
VGQILAISPRTLKPGFREKSRLISQRSTRTLQDRQMTALCNQDL